MNKVGFIGLGIMGKPMALNLIKGNCETYVYDINQAAVNEVVAAGGIGATLKQIAVECERIFLILPNGAIVKQVIFEGLFDNLKTGTIVCDLSSITPTESKEIYAKLKEIGVGFVDAPVSGGEPGAIGATLAFMAGGDVHDFNELMPYYNIMGKSALLVGASGSGNVTKLANQIIVNNTIAIVSEAFVLATKAGADPLKVYEAIRGGLAGSVVLDAKIPMIVERNFKPGGKISINHKDIKNVLDTAHQIDVPVPYTAQLFEILQALKVDGHMGDDHGGIVQYFEKLAQVEVKKVN
ncbi:NAD(P)-binding domain-containing protein [Candidatus Epulonipiscium viviparus]|uniref:NAD(P)-binding domain-containing protein n=1 Tax=Candidatus Epulonipiscium viviparus TaxID=420336 RepID=UPI0027380A73|nr:NAD(P)-binding domain-containing protein [Candidatus Epulopiscium viviparus]